MERQPNKRKNSTEPIAGGDKSSDRSKPVKRQTIICGASADFEQPTYNVPQQSDDYKEDPLEAMEGLSTFVED